MLKEKNKSIATLLAFAMIPMSGLATDIYLPSMPSMALELQQPETKIQLTLTLFLISYGVTQIFAGSVVDSFGRYRVSLVSLGLFAVSFLVTALTKDIMVIYAMRVLQGVLAGFAVVAKRAFFVDVFEGAKRIHYLSVMTIVWSVGPIVAPFIGGYLQKLFGWQSNFYVLAIYSFLLLIFEILFSGETLKVKKPFAIQLVLKEYDMLFRAKDFFYGMLMCGISYAMVIFFNLCGAFIIEHEMGYSEVVAGYVSLILGFAWMSGGFLGKFLINKDFLPKIRVANYAQIVLILLMIFSSFYLNSIYSLVAFAFVIHVTAGFIFNNYFAYCLGRFPNSAGVAGGLTGGVSYIITSAVSYSIVAMLRPTMQLDVAEGYLIMGILGFLILSMTKFRKAYR
ncbi:MFS transporter [Kaistella antarctica]|uniref:Multidrug resistance protein D n=1 Tax=Kaistella antarctica TaxID=266748 RepID=A0A3S4WSB2_9FLAO|nr:MFS transporter [Kaistella antarctica]KEY19037.1 multidrug transporter [Kaistella antarctica]SEW12356.1 Predicted arabinose efflux permease, MFS family [Kaistella antarctica]VEH99017.1 Multidrug resistance protein D [Kaistella antarctica]